MQRTTVKVTQHELQELKKLAGIIKNVRLPLSQRRIAKSQYETIIKYAKHSDRLIM
ncbi:hypothetical protein [Paenibacillus daejeonensis]|uniref:hypothetical protein n=1 Tax=Paenibacillus daejeonensis TaxID=135193 RepID=UPI00035E7BBC|nr:hypothetical protein [Paenibacillus daejeonensis]